MDIQDWFPLGLTGLIMAVLGLRSCTRAFSSWDKRGLLSSCSVRASHGDGFSSCGAWVLEHRLNSCGLVAPRHVESSQIRNRSHVSCIGRWILYHWATREAPILHFSFFQKHANSTFYTVRYSLLLFIGFFKRRACQESIIKVTFLSYEFDSLVYKVY